MKTATRLDHLLNKSFEMLSEVEQDGLFAEMIACKDELLSDLAKREHTPLELTSVPYRGKVNLQG